jgi:hypothetical protein
MYGQIASQLKKSSSDPWDRDQIDQFVASLPESHSFQRLKRSKEDETGSYLSQMRRQEQMAAASPSQPRSSDLQWRKDKNMTSQRIQFVQSFLQQGQGMGKAYKDLHQELRNYMEHSFEPEFMKQVKKMEASFDLRSN